MSDSLPPRPQPPTPPTEPLAWAQPTVMPYAGAMAPRKHGMAVAALVLSIVGLVLCPVGVGALFALIGVILGIIALVKASTRPMEYGGKGMAIGGISVGAVALLLVPIGIAIALPSISRARELAKRTVDQSNLASVMLAVRAYASANGNQNPPDLDVLVRSGALSAAQLQNPSDANDQNACDYSYVAGLSADDLTQPGWILAYSDPKYHNGEGANILFADGTVQFLKEPQFQQAIEKFKAEYEKKHHRRPRIVDPH